MKTSLWLGKLAGPASFLAVTDSLWAAENEHRAAEPSLFAGDLGNVIWTLIIFGVLLFVLGKFAWRPLLAALQRREEFIRDSLAQAKKEREEAEAKHRQIEDRLATARGEAGAIVEEGRRGGEEIRRLAHHEARRETDALIEQAKREISLARDTAVKELYDLTATLATEVASRVIGKEVDAADHQRLIAEAIAELAEGNGKGTS